MACTCPLGGSTTLILTTRLADQSVHARAYPVTDCQAAAIASYFGEPAYESVTPADTTATAADLMRTSPGHLEVDNTGAGGGRG